MSNNFKVDSAHYKILYSIYEYNQNGYVPTTLGLLKTLNADEEIDEEFRSFKTYGSLVSIKSKQLSRMLIILLRHNYIKLRYFDDMNEKFYELTSLGKAVAEEHRKISKKSKNAAKVQYLYKKVK